MGTLVKSDAVTVTAVVRLKMHVGTSTVFFHQTLPVPASRGCLLAVQAALLLLSFAPPLALPLSHVSCSCL